MTINWAEVHKNSRYKELEGYKNHIRDMIDGELNRISVSDTIEEKTHLLSFLKKNIETYYDVCCECTKLLHEYELNQ